MAMAVFVSSGTPHLKSQEDFISAVEDHLKSHGCTPITVGRSKYAVRQPVEAVRDCIAECRGAVVIAFERTRILEAVEYPDSDKAKPLSQEMHPTVWTHMESAMAYSRDIPILALVQTGIKRHGMLSSRFEWAAIEGDLSPGMLRNEQFRQIFADWFARVSENSKSKMKEQDISEIKLDTLFRQLNLKQAFAVLAIAIGMIGTVATGAFKLGQTFPSVAQSTTATK